jgi:hypothetical protein
MTMATKTCQKRRQLAALRYLIDTPDATIADIHGYTAMTLIAAGFVQRYPPNKVTVRGLAFAARHVGPLTKVKFLREEAHNGL